MSGPPPVPWAKPRLELLVLALVAVAALSTVYGFNPQDNSRLCLSQAIAHGRLHADRCFGLDHSTYHRHRYSDKAPGLSFVELPLAEAVRLPPGNRLHNDDRRLWVVRVLSVGVAFLACAFLVGRVSEGLAPGFGSLALVTFALGTLVAPFAAANFGHVPAAALGFGAFLLAWRRRPLSAGLLAGAAVVVEYQAALIAVVLAAYLALATRRAGPVARYAAGLLPGAAVLGAYDWLAFGAPWRLSYRYVANTFSSEQAGGFFGIGLPHLHASWQVFAGANGLLVLSPVVVAAVWGLVLLRRRHPLEALVCATVTAAFVLVNCGYFLPYGGSPGPRFLVPALPFLAVGFGPAFAWRPRLTVALALLSVVTITARLLVWEDRIQVREGIWGRLARVPVDRGSSTFVQRLEPNVFAWAGTGRIWGAALTALFALAAFAVAVATVPRAAARRERAGRRRLAGAVVAASLALVAAAEASAVIGFPYGPPQDLVTQVQGSVAAVVPGQEVDFTVTARNRSIETGYGDVVLTIELTPGMRLRAQPAREQGRGCTGIDTTTISCDLVDLAPRASTQLRAAVEVTKPGPQTLTAWLSATGARDEPRTSFTVQSS